MLTLNAVSLTTLHVSKSEITHSRMIKIGSLCISERELLVLISRQIATESYHFEFFFMTVLNCNLQIGLVYGLTLQNNPYNGENCKLVCA